MTAYMERTYLDDLRAEWEDARDDERRHPVAHHGDCPCDRCLADRADEYDDDEPRNGWQRL